VFGYTSGAGVAVIYPKGCVGVKLWAQGQIQFDLFLQPGNTVITVNTVGFVS
jgi:hypothetical protein